MKTTNTVTGELRSFFTQKVVVAAGSTESPKLINRSSVFHTLPDDIQKLVGFGLTDHPVSSESQAYVTSVGNPRIDISPDDHAKIIFHSKGRLDADGHVQYPFNVEMNVNHEYWHLRNTLVGVRKGDSRTLYRRDFSQGLFKENGVRFGGCKQFLNSLPQLRIFSARLIQKGCSFVIAFEFPRFPEDRDFT